MLRISHFRLKAKPDSTCLIEHKLAFQAPSGFSLIEVMFILVFLSLIIVPFTIVTNQSARFSKSVYVQSSRNLSISSASDLMDPDRQDYYSTFNDSAISAWSTDSGQDIPFMTKVDTTNTNAFTKTAYLYAYNNVTDSTSSPTYAMTLFNSSDIVRMRCGSTSAFTDSSNMVWLGDQAYNSGNKQPGYYTTGTTSSSGTNVVNTNPTDDPLFQNWREATSLEYRFDVPDGDYTVMLYFSEMSGVTSRYLNISLEGTQQNSTPYSAYQTVGANFGTFVNYDITVSDGTLNIKLDRDASGGSNNPRLSGIIVKRKWIQT
jgi:Tfp pilus assembly protein PilV